MNNQYDKNIDKIQKIVSLIPGHVYYKDRNGVFIWCNKSQLDDLGMVTLEEYIGKTDYDIFPKHQADLLRKNDIEVMDSGIPQSFEEPCYDKNQVEIVYFSQKIPLKNDSGAVVGLLGIAIDITERKHKELKLENEKKETAIALENIINNLPGHVYWKDASFTYRGCNNIQAKDAGYTKEEFVGKTDFEMPWKDEAHILRKYDKVVMEKDQIITSEEPSMLANGKEAIFLSKKMPLKDAENKTIGVLGISFDITAEKEAEKLRLEKKTLEEREAVTKLIAASMAHELRTPLTAIDAGLEGINLIFPKILEGYLMAKKAGVNVPFIPPMQLKVFERLIENTKMETRAAFSVIDMLLITTNTSQIDTEKFKECSIGKIVDEALKRYPLQDDDMKVIHWKRCDFTFWGDEILMTHVIFNLLKNALHYLKAANKGEIFITCDQNEKFNILHIKDTSAGMDPEVLAHIFERFFSRTRHGSGVGLAFCKLVMESFGGDISCDSVKGEYSDFTLMFPKR
ncbi:MAG: PAS domain-containing sensor histidine kinase [Legionellales bacterium]|jgi:PAS domain S-box-containing protein